MSYLQNVSSSRFTKMLFILLFIFSFIIQSFSSSLIFTKLSSDSNESITASISAAYSVFESHDCQLSGIKLRARAESCQASDNLVWKYIVTNTAGNEIIQYSYNYSPIPQTGIVGDPNLDIINQTIEANAVILPSLPLGEYKVNWTLTINAEYSVSKDQYFIIVDNIAPTPDLYYYLKTNNIIVEARDFDKGDCEDCIASSDNCSENIYFTFSDKLPDFEENTDKWEKQFAKYGKYFFDPATGAISTENAYFNANADAWIPDRNTSAKVITCELLNHTYDLKVFVWDEFKNNDDVNFNNFSAEKVYLNSDLDCRDFKINGVVKGIKTQLPLNKMDITLVKNGKTATTKTDTNGYYLFDGLNFDDEFTLKATKDSDWFNGITTLDIVIIQRHLLGIKKISDPFKIYAADVSRDKKISALDILALRKLILGKTNKFDGHSWMGIPSDISGINASNCLSEIDKKINATYFFNESLSTFDFKAIKIGDVNQSANITESRGADRPTLIIDNNSFIAGDIVSIPFYTKNFNDILGMQFSLNLDVDSVESIESGAINIDKGNFNIVNSELLISWNSSYATTIKDNEILFTLNLRANQSSDLNRILSLSGFIQAETYARDFEVNRLNLAFRNDTPKFELFQNEPNPFTESTSISFVLEDDSEEYSFYIYNMNGQLLKSYKNRGKKGLNTITITTDELNRGNLNTRIHSPNILLFKLISGDHTAIKKMVITQ